MAGEGESRSLYVGRRRVVTLRGDPRHFRMLLGQMDGSTAKRRAVRRAALTLSTIGLLNAVSRCSDAAERADVDEITAHLRDVAADRTATLSAVAVMWPISDRAHRRYIVAADSRGQGALFGKFSTRPDVDGDLFAKEHSVLSDFEERGITGWNTPRSYGLRRSEQRVSLVLQALPASRRHLSWEEVVRDLPLSRIGHPSGEELRVPQELTWFAAGLTRPASQAFHAFVGQLATTPIPVGVANGDIRPSNAVATGTGHWLYDWEFADLLAPRSADLVAAALNRNPPAITSDTGAGILVRLGVDPVVHGVSIEELALSLLYLATVDHPGALSLMAGWS